MTNPHVRVRKPVDPQPEDFSVCPVLRGVPDSMLTVVGIDQSLTATGVAVLRGNRLRSEVLKPPKGMRGVLRLSWFRQMVTALVRGVGADIVFFEGYGFGARGGRVFDLGELGGVLKLAVLDCGVPHGTVPPSTLKLFATGKGNAEKAMVSKELFKRYDVDLTDNNAVDAAGLALMALAHLHGEFRETLIEPQRRAMQKVEEQE